MPRAALWSAILVALPATVVAVEDQGADRSVGVATMLANGTILIGVGGNGPGARAQAVLEIHPGDTNYQMIVDHVGGLKPGETKLIPPWPDPPAPPSDPPPAPIEKGPAPVPPNRG
jgi:hypothetical protein